VRHSHADVSKARDLIGYEPTVDFREALERTVEAFRERAE
jgi:nucleoside-diphosphate-sugar epimerase